MKNIVKAIIAVTAAAFMLTGCGEEKEQVLGVGEGISSSVTSETNKSETTEPAKPETSTETKVEQTSAASSTAEKPETSTASSKPASSATTSSTSSSNPSSVATSSTATSSKPVEVPAHNHSFTKATCLTPATCTSCGATQGTLANHNFSNGTCTICGKNDPNYVAPHNCNRDGHVWGNSYTKVETESTEVVEHHDVTGNGFDHDLAYRYFGTTTVDWEEVFGPGHGWGEATTAVKTTATKTTTKYFHDCTECGKSEMCDSTEVIDPGTNWERVKPNSDFPTIWYDINNVPQRVYNDVAREDADKADFIQGLLSSGMY